MKANKSFLASIAFFFDSNSHGTNFDISSFTQRFYSKAVVIKKKGCDSLGASTDKTYFHADRPFKIPNG